MSNIVVIDASLAAMWAVPEAYSSQALVLANQWAQEHTRLIAPCLMLTEITNAFYKRVVRRESELWTGDKKFYNAVKKTMHQVKWIGNYAPPSKG